MNIIFGTVIDDNMGDNIRVTVIATGFGKQFKNIKDRTVQENRQFQQKDWFGANKKTSLEEPIETDESSIEAVFNESQRSSSTTVGIELFSESNQPQTVWGEDLTPRPSKLNQKPTRNADEK